MKTASGQDHYTPESYPALCIKKRLEEILYPPGRDASRLQGSPLLLIKVANTDLCTWMKKDKNLSQKTKRLPYPGFLLGMSDPESNVIITRPLFLL